MEKNPGLFIALEGSEGSGKAVQFKLLTERLKAVGYEVAVFDFPRYDQPSSHFVRNYLTGAYGPAAAISPYAASLFYALDRFEAAPAIRQALNTGKLVLSNRYVGSNMAHQGSKFNNPAEQRGFFIWADSLEFHLLRIPRPDLNIFLRVPARISFKLIGQKAKRSYTVNSHDEHESDIEHLIKSVKAYDLLCELFPKDFISIDCSLDGRLLGIPSINDRLWELIQPLLPPKRPQPARSVTVNLSSSRPQPAAKGRPAIKKAEDLNKLEVHLPSISLLALSLVEEIDGLTVERTPRKPASKSMPNYQSVKLPKPQTEQYKRTMERILTIRLNVDRELRAYGREQPLEPGKIALAVDSLLPMASTVSVRLQGSAEAFRQLLTAVEASVLQELSSLEPPIRQLLKNGWWPDDDLAGEKVTGSQAPEPLQETIARLAQNRLSPTLSANLEPVQLLNYWPRNEFELLADGLYPHTNLSRSEIAAEVADWPYEQKAKALRAIIKQAGQSHLQTVRYHWDVICDQVTRRGLMGLKLAEEVQSQPVTIRYGYTVPSVIEQARLEDLFMEAFDLSTELFSQLQAAKREDQAAYTSLQGHRTRLQFVTDINGLKKAVNSDSSEIPEMLDQLTEKVKEVHPIIAAAIRPLKTERSEGPKNKRLAKNTAKRPRSSR